MFVRQAKRRRMNKVEFLTQVGESPRRERAPQVGGMNKVGFLTQVGESPRWGRATCGWVRAPGFEDRHFRQKSVRIHKITSLKMWLSTLPNLGLPASDFSQPAALSRLGLSPTCGRNRVLFVKRASRGPTNKTRFLPQVSGGVEFLPHGGRRKGGHARGRVGGESRLESRKAALGYASCALTGAVVLRPRRASSGNAGGISPRSSAARIRGKRMTA